VPFVCYTAKNIERNWSISNRINGIEEKIKGGFS